MKKTILSLAAAAAMAIAPASALASTGQRVAPQLKLNATDTSWVTAAVQSDYAAIQGAQLAESKTTNTAALKLASAILVQKSKLLADAEHCASRLGIAVTPGSGASYTTYQTQLTTLAPMSGLLFAQTYAQDEVTDHEAFISLTNSEIQSGVNLTARASARFWLPIETHRLAVAEGAERAVLKAS